VSSVVHVILGTHSSFNTSIVRSGGTHGRSVRVNLSSQNDECPFQVLGITTTAVGRIYVRFDTLPSANTIIFHTAETGTGYFYGIGYHAASGELRAAYSIAGVMGFGSTGVAVTTGQFYWLGMRVVNNGTTIVTDAQIDGVSVAQLSRGAVLGTLIDQIGFGSTANVTADMYFDDIKIANASGDYPLNAGSSLPYVATSDGSHNISGANQFERGLTGVDITNSTTTAYQLVDELPMDENTPAADDYISAIAPTNATDYVEVKFGPAPGVSVPTVAPTGVEVLVGFHHGLATSGNIRLAIVDNGTVDDVYNASSIGGGNITFQAKHYTDPPSAASVWTLTSGNGNFLDLRMRFYSSDANPDQYWDGVILEVDFPLTEPPPPPGGHFACAGTLPSFITADQDKINSLKALRLAGSPIGQVFELAKVSWPSPDGDIYYAVVQVDDIASVAPPVSPIEVRLKPDDSPNWFLPVQLDASIGDEEVDLSFNDLDGAFSDLMVAHGEGIKVELFYWFPAVSLLLPLWHGHLRQEDDAEIDICKIKAVQGFRSSDLNLPRRAHYQECQAIFGAVFDTQAEIDENDCVYNRHIGGGTTGNLNGGVPYTSCPRLTRQNCIDRLGNNANFMLSHATVSSVIANNQTKGPRLYSTSQGNETNLKEPVRVVMGERRIYGMQIIAFRRDLDTRDPDHGFFYGEYEACEGPVDSISLARISVGGTEQDAVPMHYRFRLGETGQTPADPSLTIHSYSGTALITYNFGWVDPSTVDPSQASATVYTRGLNNIRVYTDETTYSKTYTNNRAWHIMHMLTNKRWGYGYDYDRLNIPAFIEAACWCDNIVRFTDFNGDTYDHVRATSNVELTERKVQQQIEDICMAGRLSRPFLFNGKIHIVPLREMTSIELAAAPVFTDEGTSRNIIWEGNKTTLKRSRVSDLDLPNRVECTFDDADNDFLETPVRPVEDVDQQLKAGRVVGDNSRKINSKKYPLLGVTVKNQAIKMAWSLLDLGPFDEGGLQNNLRLKFKIWFIDSLDLFPTKVIKITSSQITRYNFDYFRVVKIKRLDDLEVEIEAQAYNPDYMAAFETIFGSIDPIPTDPPDPVPVPPSDPPFVLDFGAVSYSAGVLYIPVV
jgi:hypothetical protein